MKVAFDSLLQWTPYHLQLGQTHVTQLWKAQAKVAKAESGVTVFGVKFRQQPGGMRVGVNSLTTGSGSRGSPRAVAAPLARSWARCSSVMSFMVASFWMSLHVGARRPTGTREKRGRHTVNTVSWCGPGLTASGVCQTRDRVLTWAYS